MGLAYMMMSEKNISSQTCAERDACVFWQKLKNMSIQNDVVTDAHSLLSIF